MGFYDDIAIVVVAKLLSQARAFVANYKTEAVLISSRKLIETANLTVGNHALKSKLYIKYLGVVIDHRLSYKQHLTYASDMAVTALI